MNGEQDFRLMVWPEPFDPADVRPSAEIAAGGLQATVVQFAALPSPPDIARLKAAYGLRLNRFIPNLAYLERLDTATANRVRADFLVRSVIPFPPASKLSPQLPTAGPLNLTVVLFEDSDAAAVTAALTALGAHDIHTLDNRQAGGFLQLRLTLDAAAALTQVAAIDDVIWIEPAPTIAMRNVEAAQTIQSGSGAGPNAGTIWNHGLHGEGQVISIIDDGVIDLNHCFFADVPPNTPGPGHRKVLAMSSQFFHPPNRHFMAVAGIAAGDELGNSGKHEHRGGAWAAKIVCHDAGDLKPRPPFTTLETLQHMLEESKRSGATIHNLSWGSGDVYNQHNREIDQFSFENEEQLVIGAGNNTNFDGLRNDGPAISYNAIGVAAANFWPDQNDIGSGKDGPTADGRRKPDLMAVGGGILTAMLAPTSPSEDVFCDTELIETATSFATPHVAAAAALVRQYFTEGWYPKGKPLRDRINTTPSGTLIKAVLLNSTVNMVGPPGYPSDAEGWGIIQLDRTLFFEGGKRKLIVKDIPLSAGLRFPDVRTYQFSVSDESEQLKITFGWTNRPPSEPSRPQVDGIRFEVEDSGGGFYFGNDMDTTTGVSRKLPVPPLVTDRVNNVQMVIVNNPVGGTWTIRLRAVGHREKQGYALVVSGGVS